MCGSTNSMMGATDSVYRTTRVKKWKLW